MVSNRASHHSERACPLHFKDTATPKFGHSNVLFDLFIETGFFAFNHPLIQNAFRFLGIIAPKLFDFMSKILQIQFIKHFC